LKETLSILKFDRNAELAPVFLENACADPYDTQLFYNTRFHGNILWILEPLYAGSSLIL
jgi:hypothetical protein